MKFTIKLKLGLAFAVMIVLLLATAIYGVTSLSELNNAMTQMSNGPVARLELAQRISVAQLQSIRQQKNLIAATTPAEIDGAREKGDVARAELKSALDKALSIATEQGKPRWLKIHEFAA